MRTRRGFYGWAPLRVRVRARWMLARRSGLGRVRAAWGILRGEFQFDRP
jgi:hypothetical protein